MRRLLLILGGGLTAVLAGGAAWSAARQALWVASAPASRQAIDAAAAAVLAPAAWLLVGWLGAIAALAGVAAGPGRGSARANRLLARLAPAVLRRAAAGLAGASLAAGVWAGPALANPSPAPVPEATSFDWGPPSSAASPLPAPRVPPPAAEAGLPAEGAAVTVRPGDCLWRIAAASLASAGAAPSPAEIAAAWPRWYAANRSVIGDDPGLIHPGQRLTAPTPVPAPTPAPTQEHR
jgi:hypothetical protein